MLWQQAHSFEVDVDSTPFSPYISGGIATQVKEAKVLKFQSLSDAIARPGEFLLSDFSKFERSPLLHIGFQALDPVSGEPSAALLPEDIDDGAMLHLPPDKLCHVWSSMQVWRVHEVPPMPPSFVAALRFWAKLGWIGFGGPTGQIAILHEELVVRRGWIEEADFLQGLNFLPDAAGARGAAVCHLPGLAVAWDSRRAGGRHPVFFCPPWRCSGG